MERECLAAAVEFYRNTLLSESDPLAYATSRGVSRQTLDRLHVGYCSGTGLIEHLQWLRLPVRLAVRAGLLQRDCAGRLAERMAGRVVVPELRKGSPVWLVGRAWEPPNAEPKYLGLPGAKPLLGWDRVCGHNEVFLTEGVFDWLVLVEWGLPAAALVGTHANRDVLRSLHRFNKVYLALDSDEAGRAAAARLIEDLGNRAIRIELPGVKDVAELAIRSDGRKAFLGTAPVRAERHGSIGRGEL